MLNISLVNVNPEESPVVKGSPPSAAFRYDAEHGVPPPPGYDEALAEQEDSPDEGGFVVDVSVVGDDL